MKMRKVDLHVHSKYSEHPSQWFLQRIGTAESYTDPETIYKMEKERGMDWVTISDHNRIEGALQLRESHPEDTFISVEATTYFPEDNCKIHVLVFDINEDEFALVQDTRKDIYQFRSLLKERGFAYAVAHPTFSVNGLLRCSHLEKLLLLFDVYEGINGSRNKINNNTWMRICQQLTPEKIEKLYQLHKIEPFSDTPWEKHFVAGSDDHAGLYMGYTYTQAKAGTIREFMERVRCGGTIPSGRHNDYQSLTFAIYKIGFEFSRRKGNTDTIFNQINDFVFENKKMSVMNRLKLKTISINPKSPQAILKRSFDDLVSTLRDQSDFDLNTRTRLVFEKITELVDNFFALLFDSVQTSFEKGDLFSVLVGFSSTISGIFLTMPFFSNLQFLFRNRQLLAEFSKRLDYKEEKKRKLILWFTDTFDDLNGVAATLTRIHHYSVEKDYPIAIVSAYDEKKDAPKYINLPTIFTFKLPYYEYYKLRLPSPLKAMDMLQNLEPTEIIVSTPGPIGVFGLLAGKMLNVPVTGIYHTDFTEQLKKIKNEQSLLTMLEMYTIWFYRQMDDIRVPTNEYMRLLSERGLENKKMKIFPRGLEHDIFVPIPKAREIIRSRHHIKNNDFIFLYTGRISHDKSLRVILDAFKEIAREHPQTWLLLAGDGPHRKEYERDYMHKRIKFLGRIERNQLATYYAGADVFVFPSRTDTYGMSVLEAQSCGLPVLVSNEGGPKEIIINGETGFIISDPGPFEWKNKMEEILDMSKDQPEDWAEMARKSRENAVSRSKWDNFFKEFVG